MLHRFKNHWKHHRKPWAYYVWKWGRKGKESYVFLTRGLGELEVPKRLLHTYKECFFDDSYFKGFPQKFVPEYVVDAGANVGYFSLSLLNRYPKAKVLAFEPMPKNLVKFRSYLEGRGSLGIRLMPLALAAHDRGLVLHYLAEDTFSTGASCFSDDLQHDTLQVGSQTLAKALEAVGWSRLDLLKLDCEGAEYQILYSLPDAWWPKLQRLAIETHRGPSALERKEALMKFLNQKGYRCQQLRSKIWAWREAYFLEKGW